MFPNDDLPIISISPTGGLFIGKTYNEKTEVTCSPLPSLPVISKL